MSDKKTKITVEIYGESYALKGDVEPERIMRLAAMLDERMKKTAKANLRLSPTKIAVLTALNIADEFLRLEQDYLELIELIEKDK
ncbi:cell division protein ZapA [Sporomusa aerivorans]|uniref:cell division protein ZapA n=1 Tax=Sporomusa aerivorans TaxID=204936 RepID=UPI00352B56BA